MLVKAIDVASYQPRDLSEIIRRHAPQHVVVRLYLPWEAPSQEHSLEQLASARSNNCSAGGYVWCYRASNPEDTVREAVFLASLAHLKLPILWLDCETYAPGGQTRDPGPNTIWLRAARAAADQLKVKLGIYTAAWWWGDYMQDTAEFADLPLWTATYNHVPDLNVPLYGGWQRAYGHQYSANEVDLDVFDQEVTQVLDADKLNAALTQVWDVRRALAVKNVPSDPQTVVERLRQYAGELTTLEHPNYGTALSSTADELTNLAARLFDAVVAAKEAAGLQ